MEIIQQLMKNYILSTALLAWISAQVLKTLFTFVATRKLNLERLVGAGGMPSAHSAMVCALTIAVSRKTGVDSPDFAIAFILSAIVMYDAMGVRRAAGEQAKILNKIVFGMKGDDHDRSDELSDVDSFQDGELFLQAEQDMEEDGPLANKELKEFLGHTPLEVLGGALLGIMVAVLMPA